MLDLKMLKRQIDEALRKRPKAGGDAFEGTGVSASPSASRRSPDRLESAPRKR